MCSSETSRFLSPMATYSPAQISRYYLVRSRRREKKYNIKGLFEPEETNTLIFVLFSYFYIHPHPHSQWERDLGRTLVYGTETNSSLNPFPFLLDYVSQPSLPLGMSSGQINFGWKWYAPFPGLVHKDLSCIILHALFFITMILETVYWKWWSHIGKASGSSKI